MGNNGKAGKGANGVRVQNEVFCVHNTAVNSTLTDQIDNMADIHCH